MVSATSTPPQPHHGQRVAGHEVAVLVEDAVVGQVVLEVAGDHLAAVQQRASALRGRRRRAASALAGAGPSASR